MKKLLKIAGYTLAGIVLLVIFLYLLFSVKWSFEVRSYMKNLGPPAATIDIDGQSFRDLNKNEVLDPYEDHRLDLDTRVEDLLHQMNDAEKAGLLFINMTTIGENGKLTKTPSIFDPFSLILDSNTDLIVKKKINHANVLFASSAEAIARWNNNMQVLAERTRLGIPVTIASDPRHGTENNPGASIPSPYFSSWCSPLGFAATRDTLLMREFGDIARQEYLAVGIRLALHPMADLGTEPRWGRFNGTFGEDAYLSADMTKAYLLGFQGDSLSSESVACMTKHFSGAGPQEDGEDAHFPYGTNQIYPGGRFRYHMIPFEAAFEAGTAQIMPYYGVPVGQTSEEVAFGYNKDMISGWLRDTFGFDGVVCTDWGIVSGSRFKPAAAWGVEHMTEVERIGKILDAGCDMFGGESNPEWVLELLEKGALSEERLNESVRRVLRDKFRLGLFDDPFVDLNDLDIVNNDAFKQSGRRAQEKSLVLLKNEDNILPLDSNTKVYLKGMDKSLTDIYENVVDSPQDADVQIIKLDTPFEPRSQYMLERFFKQGRIHFNEQEKEEHLATINQKPTITIMTMTRPTVFPDINKASAAVIADFNCQQEVIMDLIFGKFSPSGKLPFEIPSSPEAVENQMEDVPYDSDNPLYTFGFGLDYK